MISKLFKVFRFIKIYGFNRTLIKILGRSEKVIPISFYLKFPFLMRKGKKIGLIGCGHHTFSSLAYFISKYSNAKIIWAYDINTEAQNKLIKQYAIPQLKNFKSIDDLKKPDVVYIASNHSSHTDYAIKFINMECDVYIEKPISISLEQLEELDKIIFKKKVRVFAGYNRPFSKAVKLLKDKLYIHKNLPMSVNCFVIGHKIPEDHWYRDEREGTRIIGNVGHWIDLTVNLLLSKDDFPECIDVDISYSNLNLPSENIAITLTTPKSDLISIVFSAREEPFEGVSETINFQCGSLIAKINDFRSIQVWDDSKYAKTTYFPKDNGHKQAALQPLNDKLKTRPWEELKVSTSLMLYIEELVKNRKKSGKFIYKI